VGVLSGSEVVKDIFEKRFSFLFPTAKTIAYEIYFPPRQFLF